MSMYKYITASVKEPTSDPRLTESDRHLWPEERRNRTYNHSGVIDEVGGSNPHTERMLNAGNGLQLLNMDRQEPTLPAPVCNQIRLDFFHPQHTCAIPVGGGLLLSRMSHAPFATRWDGATISLLRVRGKFD